LVIFLFREEEKVRNPPDNICALNEAKGVVIIMNKIPPIEKIYEAVISIS